MLVLRILCALSFTCATASAQSYEDGVQAFVGKDYETAFQIFVSVARSLRDKPSELLYNLALVSLRLNNPFLARSYFRAYLHSVKDLRRAYEPAGARKVTQRIIDDIGGDCHPCRLDTATPPGLEPVISEKECSELLARIGACRRRP